MALELDLADSEAPADRSVPPPGDALLAALLELAQSAEDNQAPDRRKRGGENEAEQRD